MSNVSEPQNRRQWIASCTRYVLLGTLTAGTIVLAGRRGAALGDDCGKSLPCRGCALLSGCKLPRAMTVRQGTRGSKE